MKILKGVAKFFAGSNPLKEVADVVDRFTDSKDDKREFFIKVFEMRAQDRAGARDLYSKDSIMQKVYSLVFLLAYLGLTGWLVYAIIHGSIKDISQFETGMISGIWGGMTAKVNTITDFFFGAAEEKSDKNYDQLIGKKRK